MKVLFGTMAVMATFAARAVDVATMKPEVGGATPSTAADYLLESNWEGGLVGSADGCKVTITNGAVYFACGRPITVGSLNGGGASLLTDATLTLGSNGGGTFPKLERANFYAPVQITKYSEIGWLTTFCGDVTAASTLRFVGTGAFRADRYANDTNPDRTNPWPTGEYLLAACDLEFYAPPRTEAVTGDWRLTANSPFAMCVGTSPTLAVGTSVTGEGIADGTFLRRVFPDGSIELSQAAQKSADAETLTFAAFRPILRQTIGAWRAFGADGRLQARQYGMDDGLEIVVQTVADASLPRIIDVPATSGFCPGTVVIQNGADNTGLIKFGRAHVAFDVAGPGKMPGFPRSSAQQLDAQSDTRLTVTNGLTAVLGSFSNVVGTVTKDGAGALTVSLADAAETKLGTFDVLEGTLTLRMPAGIRYAVSRVAVAAGATLVLEGEGLSADAVELSAGAKVVGPGTLAVSVLPDFVALGQVDLANGASVDYAGAGEPPVYAAPASVSADELGDPALWLDIRADGSVVTAADGVSVERWNDRRGDGHLYAEKMTAAPVLIKDGDTPLHVYMAPSKSLDASDHQVLVWNRRLTNIRAVFVVKNCREGGGSLLGDTTSSLWTWKRAPTSSFSYPLFDEPNAAVAGGWFYLNGELRDPATGYGYPGAAQDTDVRDLKPVLVECITDGETAADNFSFHQGRGQMISGGMRIYEALVYTNELTNAQRVKVEKYLMDRWIDRGYSPEAVPARTGGVVEVLDASAGAVVGVADRHDLVVRTVEGTGGDLVKTGRGTMHVTDFGGPEVRLSVRAGKLAVRSVSVTEETLPGEPAFHVDASDANSLTLSDSIVKAWKDVRGMNDNRFAAPIPGCWGTATLVANAVGDKPAVSFGAVGSYPAYENPSPELAFSEAIPEVRSYVGVVRAGLGILLGNSEEDVPYVKDGVYNGMYRRDFGGTATWPFLWRNPYERNGSDDFRYGFACPGPGATSLRVNGEEASVIETVPADEFQVLAISAVEGVRVSGFTQSCFKNDSEARYHFGGNAVAEVLYYAEALSKDELKRAEAYLNRKWFGRETPGYRPARAKSLHVEAGAEAAVLGGAPLTVEALSGLGRVDGSITVADGGTLEVVVAADGVPVFPEVGGTLCLDGDGTVVLNGNVRRARSGSYCLAPVATVAGRWTPVLAEGLSSRKKFSLVCRDGGLWLDVRSPGALILIR